MLVRLSSSRLEFRCSAAGCLIAAQVLLMLAAGCASRKCLPRGCDSGPVTPLFDCRQAEREPLVPDVSSVPELGPRAQPIYCALPEQDVQCLAAFHSTTGNLLDRESQAVVEQPARGPRCATNRGLLEDVLAMAAIHQRNQDAAAALEIYLRLVEAEAGHWNLEKQLEQVAATLGDIQRLTESGLLPPISKTQVEMQRLELQHRQAELQPTILSLNERLARMLNVELLPNARFWPEVQLVVEPQVPDADQAAMEALAHRADLAAVRWAAQADSRDQIAAAKLLMQSVGGGLTTSMTQPALAVLHTCAVNREAPLRNDQIEILLADRERQAESETRQAVEMLRTRLEQIELTRRRLALARQHIGSLQEQQDVTSGATFELRKARSDALVLEQALLHDTIEWKLAVVRLKQAQGILAVECGYDVQELCD